MKIERDRVQVKSGIRHGVTLGSPLALEIANLDFPNWERDRMAIWEPAEDVAPITLPRPGHADLAGMQKYGTKDLRNILERASARETAARVAAGAVAKADCGGSASNCEVTSCESGRRPSRCATNLALEDFEGVDDSPVRCLDKGASERMKAAIKAAGQRHDTLGGVFEVWAFGLMPGLGSHCEPGHPARRPARPRDALHPGDQGRGARRGLRAGAAARQPVPRRDLLERGAWLLPPHQPLRRSRRRHDPRGAAARAGSHEADLHAHAAARLRRHRDEGASQAFKERSDICAVPAAAVVGEAAVAFVLAQAPSRSSG